MNIKNIVSQSESGADANTFNIIVYIVWTGLNPDNELSRMNESSRIWH